MSAARILPAVLALLVAGCASRQAANAPPPPRKHFSADAHGTPIRRVAMLPMFHVSYPDAYLSQLDETFESELTKTARFEVKPVNRGELETLLGRRQIESTEKLPADALEKLRKQFAVEGVVFTDLTHFSPYKPVSMGVRTKLVDVSTGKIRWAFDYVFDAGNASIADAAKRYQLLSGEQGGPSATDGGSILLSPARFAEYVARETFASLTREKDTVKPPMMAAVREISPRVPERARR